MIENRTSSDTVHILCAANPAFAMPLCVMLVSALCNLEKNRKLEVHVIDSGLSERDREKIENSLSANRSDFKKEQIHWLALDPELIQSLPVTLHVSSDTYSRLLAPYLLPVDCERVIYLDSDMVVLADLAEVYDSISDEKIVLAVHDVGVPYVSSEGGVFNYAELGIPPQTRYFNGGILGINMKRWREEKVTERILHYLDLHKGSVSYWDQGGLNAILYNEWGELDLVWNQCTHPIFHPQIWAKAGYSRKDWRRIRDHAAIIHFSGGDKPWKPRRIPKPRGVFFFKYFDKTVYKGTLKRPWLETFFGYKIYSFMWRVLRTLIYKLLGKVE